MILELNPAEPEEGGGFQKDLAALITLLFIIFYTSYLTRSLYYFAQD